MGTVALDGNDPGGILNGTYAQSQPGYTGANGIYAAFDSLQSGFNAQVNLLTNSNRYLAGNGGQMTIAQIANNYEGGTAPQSYINSIASFFGGSPNTVINAGNVGQFAAAQAQAENGNFKPASVNGASNICGTFDVWCQVNSGLADLGNTTGTASTPSGSQGWVGQFQAWLANSHFWQRIGIGLLGLLLIIGAIFLLGTDELKKIAISSIKGM